MFPSDAMKAPSLLAMWGAASNTNFSYHVRAAYPEARSGAEVSGSTHPWTLYGCEVQSCLAVLVNQLQ